MVGINDIYKGYEILARWKNSAERRGQKDSVEQCKSLIKIIEELSGVKFGKK